MRPCWVADADSAVKSDQRKGGGDCERQECDAGFRLAEKLSCAREVGVVKKRMNRGRAGG